MTLSSVTATPRIQCREITDEELILNGKAGRLYVALIGTNWVPAQADPPPETQLIFLHAPEAQALEWRGRGGGYVLSLPVADIALLSGVSLIAPFFQTWQPPRVIEVPTADLLKPLHAFLMLMSRGMSSEGRDDSLSLSLRLAMINCSAFLLALRQLLHDHLPHDPISQPRRVVARYTELVERRFAEWGELERYARELHVTKDHLSNLCRQVVGMGAKEFLLLRRFKEAKDLLRGTKLSIKEIAYGVGFEDHAYFSRAFTERFGLTPSQFREERPDS